MGAGASLPCGARRRVTAIGMAQAHPGEWRRNRDVATRRPLGGVCETGRGASGLVNLRPRHHSGDSVEAASRLRNC
ncbi:MAG: hypothetical protein JWP07_2921 [Pseudonocardiales bacterium]|nr:hypothetical protein [Pseudonocardiales bacterium]